MRRVLIITYFFRQWVASVRLGGLVKYLPELGWEPIILTTSFPENINTTVKVVQTPYYDHDIIRSLKMKLGFNPEVGLIEHTSSTSAHSKKNSIPRFMTKAFGRILREFMDYPDPEKGWYPFAVEFGQDILYRERIDAILSTSPPETSHLIARSLKLKYNRPWVADLRDLWTQNHYYRWSFLRRAIDKRLELRTLALADSLTTVSQPLVERLSTLHCGKYIYSIPNGFDPEEPIERHTPLTDKFTITYTGSLYKGRQNSALLLFTALKNLISNNMIAAYDIKVLFYGWEVIEESLTTLINSHKLWDIAEYCGNISRSKALEKQRESQLLLLLNWNHPEERGVYTGKIFEYLAAQRPVLAIGGPGGVVKDLLEETNAGIYTSNLKDLQEVLLRYYSEYKSTGKVSYRGHKDKIQKYNHREMAQKFAMVLEKVCSKGELEPPHLPPPFYNGLFSKR